MRGCSVVIVPAMAIAVAAVAIPAAMQAAIAIPVAAIDAAALKATHHAARDRLARIVGAIPATAVFVADHTHRGRFRRGWERSHWQCEGAASKRAAEPGGQSSKFNVH